LHLQQQQQPLLVGLPGPAQVSSCRRAQVVLLLGASVLMSLPWTSTPMLANTTSSSSSSADCQAAQQQQQGVRVVRKRRKRRLLCSDPVSAGCHLQQMTSLWGQQLQRLVAASLPSKQQLPRQQQLPLVLLLLLLVVVLPMLDQNLQPLARLPCHTSCLLVASLAPLLLPHRQQGRSLHRSTSSTSILVRLSMLHWCRRHSFQQQQEGGS
jgi:hypothetical protein